MRFKIKYKLILAFTLMMLAVLLLTAMMMKSSFQRGFLNYINETESERLNVFAARLEQLYALETNWHFLQQNPQAWQQVLRPQPSMERPDFFPPPRPFPPAPFAPPPQPFPPPSFPPPPPFGSPFPPPPPGEHHPTLADPLDIHGRLSLVDADNQLIIGQAQANPATKIHPLTVGNKIVGYLHLEPLRGIEKQIDVDFAKQQAQALYGTVLLGLLLASGIAVLMAHHMTMPIKHLVSGAQALTSGRFEQRMNINTQDELEQLAENFNILAATLEQNRTLQRQWIADISHELRTPLAILHGEIQAIEDGVRDFNLTSLQSLASEVNRLNLLIDDLYQLSLADSGALRYDKKPLDLTALLQARVAAFSERLQKSFQLKMDFPAHLPFCGDAQRLGQVFSNLLENTIRYTDKGGKIYLHGRVEAEKIRLHFEDSKPAVPDEAIAKLFDRLYRVDPSRNREYGGSGLGLAICKNIIQAHGGTIRASHSALGGLCIEIQLPFRHS